MGLLPLNRAPTHPGEMLLQEFLRPLGLTQRDLATAIGVSYPRVNELIHGKRGVTPDTALRLAQLLGTSPELWLNLQMTWDLYHASRAPAARRIKQIKRLSSLPLRARRHTAA